MAIYGLTVLGVGGGAMRLLIVTGALVVLLGAAVGVHAAPAANPEAARIAVIEAVSADPGNFAGTYTEADGTLVIQYVGSNAGRAAVEQAVAGGTSVRWEKVEHSRAELKRLAGQVKALHLDGVFAISSGTSRNEVVVKVGPSGSTSEVAKALSGYGDGIAVERSDDFAVISACTNRLACTLWRGGIAIFRNDTGGACTWGFQANRNGLLTMVTAGHCQLTGGKFNHGGVTIASGGVGRNSLNPATFDGLDVERSFVNGPYYPTTTFGQNVLYADDNTKKWTMTAVRSSGGYGVGQNVAKSGIASSYSIGYLSDIDFDYQLMANNPGELIYYPSCSVNTPATCPWVWGMVATTNVDPGDSGSPVFDWTPSSPSYGHTFLGIVSAEGPAFSVFVPAYAAAASTALDLDFWCTTSGC